MGAASDQRSRTGPTHALISPHSPLNLRNRGLSLVHISPQPSLEKPVGSFLISSAQGGNCSLISQIGESRRRPSSSGVRGKINGFSRHSRGRMIEAVNSIDRSRVLSTWFLTYTVPTGEADWASIETFRDSMFKRLDRRWEGCCGIWKKEPHESGTPHIHMILFWLTPPPSFSEFREWNDHAWAGVVKSENPHHLRVGCRVDLMKSWNGVAFYAAKYMSKIVDGLTELNTGKLWGYFRRSLLPITVVQLVVPDDVGKRVVRALRKLQQKRRRKWLVCIGGEWRAVRELRHKSELDGRVSVSTVQEQLNLYALSPFKVKRVIPRCSSTRAIKVWAEVTCTNSKGRPVVSHERLDDERHTFAGTRHLVSTVDVHRLVMLFGGSLCFAGWPDDVAPF